MLSSFFNKSKPINFIVVGLYMLLFYSITNYKYSNGSGYIFLIAVILGIVSYIFTMLVVNEIAQKNDLTKKSTNSILLFAFLTVIISNALINPYILLSNLFLIMGVKKVIYLVEEKKIMATIFDASLWIGLASLVYFWSISFMIVLYVGIFYFQSKNFRNWIIPIVGLFTIYVCANMFMLLFFDSFFDLQAYVDDFSFSYKTFFNQKNFFTIITFLISIVILLSVYITKLKRKSAKTRPIFNIITAYFVIAIFVSVVTPQKNTAELIFMAAPISIIGTTYLEIDQHSIIKEINVWLILVLPFISLFF